MDNKDNSSKTEPKNLSKDHINSTKEKINKGSQSPNTSFADAYQDKVENQDLANVAFIRKMQKLIMPYKNKIRHIVFAIKENFRFQRMGIVGTLLTLIFGSLFMAQFTSTGYIIHSTPINSSRQFLNGDTAEISHISYDSNSQTALLNITTNSSAGVLNSKDLSANFIIMKAPNHPVKTPTLDLVSTYSNHFTILLKHLYKGFGAFKVVLSNSRNTSLQEFAHALKNGSNNQTNDPLTKKQVHIITNYNSGNKNATSGTGLDGNISVNNGDNLLKAQQLIKKIKDNNTTKFILKENTLQKYSAKINSNVNPKDIMKNNLNIAITNLKNDIKTQNKLIDEDNNSIKSINDQIKSAGNDKLNSKHSSQINQFKANIDNLNQNIKDKHNKIKQDKNYINDYQNKLILIEKGNITFNETKKVEKASLFQP